MPQGRWLQTTLGALCDQTGGTLQTGPFGSQLHAHDYETNGEVAVVPTSAIGRRRLLDENVERIGRGRQTNLRATISSRGTFSSPDEVRRPRDYPRLWNSATRDGSAVPERFDFG